MPSNYQQEENLNKVFPRHYHKAAQATFPINSKSRRDLEIQRRRNRARLMKWCTIGFILLSLTLASIEYI